MLKLNENYAINLAQWLCMRLWLQLIVLSSWCTKASKMIHAVGVDISESMHLS